jgi:ankyrin repeat protein
MKSQLIAIVAAVLLVGCGPSVDIHQAAKDGNIKAVKQHLADSVDVNAQSDGGSTPLQLAAIYDHKEIAELLIAGGADVNAENEDGWTPLHFAASDGHKEVVELFIAKGADVNVKADVGWTPLQMAAGEGHKEIVDLLRKHGGKTGEELKTEEK